MNQEIRERMINGLRINNRALTRERNDLIAKNQLLSHELAYFKERCADLEEEINNLTFVGTPMSPADIAAEAHEEELVSVLGSFLGDDY